MNWRTGILVALLAVVSAASWLLVRSNTEPSNGPVAAAGYEQGYYIRDAEIRATGPDGSVLYELVANRIVQSVSDRSVQLSGVRINVFGQPGTSWHLTADDGTITASQDEIRLNGNVRMSTPDPSESEPAFVATEELHILPQQSQVSAPGRVDMRYHGFTLSGVGLAADLAAEKFSLESSISGRFVP